MDEEHGKGVDMGRGEGVGEDVGEGRRGAWGGSGVTQASSAHPSSSGIWYGTLPSIIVARRL